MPIQEQEDTGATLCHPGRQSHKKKGLTRNQGRNTEEDPSAMPSQEGSCRDYRVWDSNARRLTTIGP